MEFTIKFDTVLSGWSIVDKKCKYFFLLRANSADPKEMLAYMAFHLGLHCLP